MYAILLLLHSDLADGMMFYHTFRSIASTEPYISACPGRALAQTSAFLAIATASHVFNIKAVAQPNKKPFDPFEATSGNIVYSVIFSTIPIQC